MFTTLIVAFREGTEAFLIVAVAAAYLRRTGRTALMQPLWAGVAVAVVGSSVLGAFLVDLGGLGSLWEGRLALLAIVLVLSCTIHLFRHGRTMKAAIAAHIDRSTGQANKRAAFGVFLFALLMIGREGSEAAAMIASLVGQTDGKTMIIGGVGGLLLAAALGSAWIHYGRAVDLTLFFNATAVFMVLFSLQLGIYALHEFAEASALPWIENADWHMATEPYGPDGEWGRLLSYSLVVAPALVIGWARLRARNTNHVRVPSAEAHRGPLRSRH